MWQQLLESASGICGRRDKARFSRAENGNMQRPDLINSRIAEARQIKSNVANNLESVSSSPHISKRWEYKYTNYFLAVANGIMLRSLWNPCRGFGQLSF